MSKFWDFVRKNPVTAILGLGREQADRASITPEDQAAARAMQRGHGQISDPPQTTGQGVNQVMAHDDQPTRPATRRRSGRLDGCRSIGQKIALVIGAIVVLALCGGVGLLVMKIGPEILIFLACLLLCIGVPIALGIGYIFYQRSQNDEDE